MQKKYIDESGETVVETITEEDKSSTNDDAIIKSSNLIYRIEVKRM